MSTTLKVIDPAGRITEVILDAQSSEVQALPGHSFLLDGAGVEKAPRVLRVDDDLVVEDLADGKELVIADFFSACTPDNVCTAALANFDRANNVAITPATQPLAALQEGSFLMFAPDVTPADLPAAPETDNPVAWKPVAAIGGGLLVLGAGLAGGGGGGGDSTPPPTPTIDPVITNNPRPVISGSAGAGDGISMTITPAGTTERVTYGTRADENGNWSIDTATAQPNAGSLPAAGLPATGSSTVFVVATDPAGNVSARASAPVVLDLTPPAAPVIDAGGELAGSGGQLILNRVEAADGTVVQGRAEPNSTVAVSVSGPGGQILSQQLATGADGAWLVNLSATQLPATDGTLTVQVTATDVAGNTGAPAVASILVDRTLSGTTAIIQGIVDNEAPVVGVIGNGARTNDTTPSIEGALSAPLAADESLQVLRDGQALGAATITNGRFGFIDTITTNGSHEYSVRVVDNAGNQAPISDTITMVLDTEAPDQVVGILARAGTTPIADGGITQATAFTLSLTISDVLAADETLQLIRTTGTGNAIVIDTATTADALGATSQQFEFSDSAAPFSSLTYEARVIDAAGNQGALSDDFVFRILSASP